MKKVYLLLSAIVFFCVCIPNVNAQDIQGYVWEDSNGNGVQNAGEAALSGVTVQLMDQFGVALPGLFDITDGIGEYTITGAVAGVTYRLDFSNVTGIDPNYVPTIYKANGGADPNDSEVNQGTYQTPNFVMPGGNLIDMDAGFYATVSIGDLVWLDDNGNGMDDDGSLPLPSSVNMTLQKETPAGSGTWLTATSFDNNVTPMVNGNPHSFTFDNYLFDNLAPGNYRVVFGTTVPLVRTYLGATTQAGDGSNTDSNANRTSGNSYTITLVSGDGLYDFVDAGYFGPTSINGVVWLDMNGDGINTEGPLASNVNVLLEYNHPTTGWGNAVRFDTGAPLGAGLNPIATSNTYNFMNLPPGDFRVVFSEPGAGNPALLHLTVDHVNDGGALPDDTNDSDADRVTGVSHEFITLSTGPDNIVSNVDAGYFLPIRIGDFVWEDLNGDGMQGAEPGLAAPPVDISLFRMDLGDVLALDVDGNPYAPNPLNQTGAGAYVFFPMPPGDYEVQFDWTEPDIFPTYQNIGAPNQDSNIADCSGGTARSTTLVMLSNDQNLTIDAGFFKPARISDYVWEDLNGDGLQNGAEVGLGGVQVEIFQAGTMNPVDYADCTPTAGTVTSDGAGAYEFINLRPGNYVLQFFTPSAPDQYYFSPQYAGNLAGDSDANVITGITGVVMTVSDTDIDNIDCGMFRAASIGNYCWHDLNGDGLDDGSEPALGGVSIAIINDDTGLIPINLTTGAPVVSPMISDGAGMYLFDNIPPGNYVLTFTEPAAAPPWYLTRADIGGGNTDATDDSDDSDADPMNGNQTHVIELESGERGGADGENDIDAGFFRAASIGNLVWHDSDANGAFDDAVGNLPAGIVITVIDLITGDDPALDVNGNPAIFNIPAGGISQPYSITNLLKPGTYDIRIDVPAGWFVTDPGQNVFDAATGTLIAGSIMLISEQVNNDIDGGVYANITVGGTVWIDQNDDCTLNPANEIPGGVNVTVQLYDDTGGEAGFTVTDAMGMYMFMNVKPGNYTIEVTGVNFIEGGALFNLLPCDGGNDPNTDTPNDNNGVGDQMNSGPVITTVIELRCGDEPAGGGLENKTIDFGFKFDCASNVNNPFANLDCQTAADNPICDLNLLVSGCATMWDFSNPTGPSPLCAGGAPHNTSWFSFFAGYGNYEIQFNLFGCLPGTGGQLGVQGGLSAYNPDSGDCWDVGGIVFCEDGLISPPGFSIPSTDFIPGQQYVMWLDGFSFSICGYSIDIIGDYEPFIVKEATEVTCDDMADCEPKCLDVEHTFVANDEDLTYNDITNLLFRWSLRDANGNVIDDWMNNVMVFETKTNEFTYSFEAPAITPGTYLICLDEIADVCGNVVPSGICQEVIIVDFPDEDFGYIEICQNDLIFYNGPITVNDDPAETDDPNSDGETSWVKTLNLVDGLNTSTFTNLFGCEIEQTVLIEELYNQGPGELDTAICGGLTPFTFDVFEKTYNNEITSLFVTGKGFASNTCDSTITINAYNLDLDGNIELLGCTPCGFALKFNQTFIANTPNAPISYMWVDALGDPVPDDGDGNPFTICVPDDGNYQFIATFDYLPQTTFIPITCPYVFNSPPISGLLPETPSADNWQNQFCEYNNTFTYVATTTDDPNDVTFLWTYPADVASAIGETTDSLTLDWTGSLGGEVCITTTNACGTSAPICDTIVIVPTPVASIVPLDSICVDSLASVSYPGAQDASFNYAWNFDTGSPVGGTNSAGPIDVSWGSPGVKTVSLTISKSGCVSSAATAPILVVEPVSPPQITCTASIDEVIFTWTDPSGSTGYIPSVLTGQTGVLSGNTLTVGSLIVGEVVNIELITNTTSPCGDLFSTGTCKAQNCPPNTVTISPIANICVDATTATFDLIDFTSLQNAINGSYVYSGTAITNPGLGTFDPKVAMVGPNVIPVVFTDEFDCVYNTSVTIRVNPTPTSLFTADNLVCIDSCATVAYTGSIQTGGVFNWSAGDIINPLNGPGPFICAKWSTPGNKTISLDVAKALCPSDVTMQPVTVEPRIQPLVINCAGEATSIDVSWGALANVTNYTMIVTYPDNTMDTFNQTNTAQTVSGLAVGSDINIQLCAESDNSCSGVCATKTCKAVNCPPTTITLTRDTTLCLDANALPFQLSALITGGLGPVGMGSGVWSGKGVDPASGMFDPAAAGVSPTGGHVITYTYTELTCINDKKMRISLINQPTSDFSAPPIICVTDNLLVSYDGSAPNLPFDWTIDGGGIVTPAGGNNFNIKWTTAGTYDIDLQVGLGTCLSDVSSISVQVDPENSPVNITCKSTLNSVTFTWNDIDCASEYQIFADNVDLGVNTSLTYTATGLAEGTDVIFEVIPNEECACPSVPATLTCTAKACPSVVIGLSTPIDSYCEGTLSNIITLVADVQGSVTPGMGTWSGDGGITPNGQFNPAGQTPGVYTFMYSYNETNCDFSETVSIEVFPNPTVGALATDPICYQDNFGSVEISPAGGTGTNYNILVNNEAKTAAELKALSPGSYTVKIADEEGCEAETSFSIQNAIAAQLELNGNTIIKAGTEGTLMADVTSIDGVLDSIVWYNGNNEVLCSGLECTTLVISPDPLADDVEYCAVMYYNDGCTVEECITITVRRTDVIILPNVIFTGSGVGNTEFYIPEYETIMQVRSMLIYDRWGNKMFDVRNVPKGPGAGWKGKFNNKAVVPGVYVYSVELDMENGEVLRFSGDITVL